MLLSLNWLKDYIPKLPAPAKLSELLMMHGLEVEKIIEAGSQFDNVVVGEIVAIRPHPNADKLRLADVVVKTGDAPLEIVCGAPNIEVGQKAPVALLGAKLPNGLTIEKRAIRGVESNGMLCATDELGLGADHSGILVLDAKAKVGTPVAEVLGLNDVVFDNSTPANRADLMSVRGLAWEIAAMLGVTMKMTPVKLFEGTSKASVSLKVSVSDEKLCPVFTVRVIRGVNMVSTPQHIVQRLQVAGMRSINIIADITNYVMLDYGQPLHAYDAALLRGDTLGVRAARNGEELVTLDGKTRKLSEGMGVIVDGDGIVGLAGVMGGKSTVISTSTTDIILEAAIFNPVSIRRTSRHFGLLSEASKRFEKGLWPSLPIQASAAAAAMIVKYCGGTVEQGTVQFGTVTSKAKTVALDPAYITERLGMKVPVATSKKILKGLGFGIVGTAKKWTVTIPPWRLDVSIPEDIVDEIGRLQGYDKLPKEMPAVPKINTEIPTGIRFREEIKNILVDMGFTEVISHAFYGEKNAGIIKGEHFEVANPLDETQHKLRKSLVPQIDDVLRRQADAGHDAAIFEIGLVFDPTHTGAVDKQQVWKVGLGIVHKGEAMLNSALSDFQKQLATTVKQESQIVVSNLVRGRMIEYAQFDVRDLLKGAKTDFGAWDPTRNIKQGVQYRAQSKYPAIIRDISFWWPADEKAMRQVIDGLQLPLLRHYKITDRFKKDDRMSFAVSFIYQSAERTLTKEEVDTLEQKIKDALVHKGATIR